MKLKAGDKVQWVHNPYYEHQFIASGTILKIYTTTTGSKKTTVVAQIKVDEDIYWALINRKKTTITLKKLSKFNSKYYL